MLKHILNDIPIIEPNGNKNGHWEIYKDAENKIIKKIWHQNPKSMSLETIYNEEKEKRKGKSNFISLDSGESFVGEFVAVKKTTGQFGEVNSFLFIVDGVEKTLNSKSFKLLKVMMEAKIKEGDNAKITKEGQGFKTTYKAEKL